MFVCFFFLIAVRVQMYISMLLGRPLVLLAVRKNPKHGSDPKRITNPIHASVFLYNKPRPQACTPQTKPSYP